MPTAQSDLATNRRRLCGFSDAVSYNSGALTPHQRLQLTAAPTRTWTDSQTHLGNDFRYGSHTHQLIWTPRDQRCVEGKNQKWLIGGPVICG